LKTHSRINIFAWAALLSLQRETPVHISGFSSIIIRQYSIYLTNYRKLIIFSKTGLPPNPFTTTQIKKDENMNRNRFIIIIASAVLFFTATVVSAVQLSQHKFNPSSRPGRAKAQIRAIVAPRTLTQAQFMQTAVDLCKKYKSRAAGSFLVQFFSSPACLTGWDGTGLLRDSDWPYWLCRVTVETNAEGQLYANTFKLAVDENTGQERTDVLKK
jgi:hypothetical protein